jgi:hypothetical protein
MVTMMRWSDEIFGFGKPKYQTDDGDGKKHRLRYEWRRIRAFQKCAHIYNGMAFQKS